MCINQLTEWLVYILLTVFAVYLLNLFLKLFLSISENKVKVFVTCIIFGAWQLFIARMNILPEIVNIIITIILTILVSFFAYQGNYWKKIIFSISFNAIWMLMEIFCGYMIMQFFDNYMEHQMLGSFISKGLMLLIIISLRKVFSDEDIRDLPVKYNILLMLIPIGSIFVVNNMFKLSNLTGKGINNFWSVISSFIMLLINVIIFNLYLKIADELELKRIATVYKQQLELYERHQHERELSMLQFRNMKHNMKNNLIAIMAYAQNQECNKIMEYVEEIMEEKCVSTTDISNTGNIVVDSLINYWSSIANKSGVDFQTNVSIPIQIPFRGADVCLILGNALENAFEAVNKLTDSKKYIKLNMMYDKGNLLISILNTYNGITIKDREGELKSTKGDADNHGIGLKSIYHTAKRYHGVVVIKNNGKEFIIKVLLYKTE